MLLFIAVTLGMTTRCLNFNTSHVTVYQSGSPYLSTVPRFQYISCYCLSDSHCMSLETQWYFNTSHVTVYHNLLSVYYSANHHFNTSHVTVYRIRTVWVWKHNGISIHLMLLFIFVSAFLNVFTSGFQYISCYCLSSPLASIAVCKFISIHLMLLFIISACIYSSLQIHFNTSHVTVYPKRKTGQPYRADISIHLMLLFIWQEWISYSIIDWHFNTSHVTVYHCKYYPDLHYLSDFNTSHVTVYPGGWCYVDLKAWFQYISCYCLSVKVGRMQEDVRYFNTSHVTVYRKKLQRFY